ncbi:MAG: prolipoprotein diacylglyceryl transferase [Bdellovibrionota bacterium]
MRPTLFHLFGLPFGSYGFFIALAHLVGLVSLFWIARVNRRPLGPFLDMVFAVVIFGVVGARLGYAYNQWGEFSSDPWQLLSLWKGGLSFYGGFGPAFLGFVLVLRWRQIPVLETADLVCPVLPLSLGIIRVGCFLEGCCYGAPTSLPWAVTYTAAGGHVPPALLNRPLHPSQLYECAFLFSLALLLAIAKRWNRLRPGVLATLSIFAYALYRLIADNHRGDLDRGFWGIAWLAPTQAAAILGILATPVMLVICARAARRP